MGRRSGVFKSVIVALALSIALIPLFHSSAQSQGWLQLSWNGCDPLVVNRTYGGPGEYNLYASVTDFSAANNGHRVKILVGFAGSAGPVPDAWRFDKTGCVADQYAVTHVSNDLACPAMQGEHPLGLFEYFDDGSGWFRLDIANTYDAFEPSQATRYLLWKTTFNHQESVTREEGGQQCSGVVDPGCFAVTQAEFLRTDRTSGVFSLGNGFVTWEDESGTSGCPQVQVAPTSWGRVKNQFR